MYVCIYIYICIHTYLYIYIYDRPCRGDGVTGESRVRSRGKVTDEIGTPTPLLYGITGMALCMILLYFGIE